MSKLTQNIVDLLQQEGLLSGNADKARELIEHMTKPDYIPGGKKVRPNKSMPWQPAPPGHRCGAIVGDDIQSGPFYCGKPADHILELEDGILSICDRHFKRIPYQ